MSKGEVEMCLAPCIVCGAVLRNFEPTVKADGDVVI